MEKIRTDGLIFDVDGTLWDSTPVVAQAWNHDLLEENRRRKNAGLPPLLLHHPDRGGRGAFLQADDLRREFGKPLENIIEDLLPDTSEAFRSSLLTQWFDSENKALESQPPAPYPGLRETLQKLKAMDIPCFIVSNCQSGYIESFLNASNLQVFFRDHLCPGDTNLYKAGNIRLMAERHHLVQPVYVGDIQADCDATRAAGVQSSFRPRFIWAAYGFGHVEAPDAVLSDIRDLPALVELYS